MDQRRRKLEAREISRIQPSFLEEELRELGETAFRQEYCGSFDVVEGLVYPDFAKLVVPIAPAGLAGQRLGGLDFGYRNPFAAVWGTLDGDDVLWLTGERYERGKPLSYHARHLPRDVCWYGDPAAAEQRAELSQSIQ